MLEEEIRTCGYCSAPFVARGYQARSDRKKFCSVTCKHKGLAIHARARQMSLEEAAFFAGIFEGEGWLSWPDRSCLTTYRIGIANTCLPLLEKIEQITGTGRIREHPQPNPNHSMTWVWYCYSSNARILLQQALPWLISKRDSVNVALGLVPATEAPLSLRVRKQRIRELDG